MTHHFLHRCLEIAEQGRGKTGTNPMVGAVLVRDGKVIAEGFHAAFGKSHAELDLMKKYEQKIDSNDILYVNLEPCCHEHKKTPPCAQMLIERGIKNVVIGMKDPNPAVSGKGSALMRSNGVMVDIAFGSTAECCRFNRGYISVQNKGRPWVTMQQARTPEGTFANPDGTFLKITTAGQDTWTHEYLRAKHDAVLIGIGTALMDNSQLTIRHIPAVQQPYRILIDSRLRIPLDAHLVNDAFASRTILIVKPDLPDAVRTVIPVLEKRGVRILEVAHHTHGIDFSALWKVLITPSGDFHGIASILLEGGKQMWKAFRDEKCIDEEAILVGVPVPGSEKRKPLLPSY